MQYHTQIIFLLDIEWIGFNFLDITATCAIKASFKIATLKTLPQFEAYMMMLIFPQMDHSKNPHL